MKVWTDAGVFNDLDTSFYTEAQVNNLNTNENVELNGGVVESRIISFLFGAPVVTFVWENKDNMSK